MVEKAQSLNAPSPIVWRPSGRLTFLSDEREPNAIWPISRRPTGKITSTMLSFSVNAKSGMEVTSASMRICVAVPLYLPNCVMMMIDTKTKSYGSRL